MSAAAPGKGSEVFRAFLRLGLTSFGGPVAHLGFFHAEFVVRRRWLDEDAYADLVALCQFLPGPASSQVGMALGLRRAGLPGLALAWLGFTLPSAVLMIGFGYGVGVLGEVSGAGWLRGLKLAAVAVVAQAVWTMAVRLCPDRPRITLALAAACGVLARPSAAAQIGVLLLGALAGRFVLRSPAATPAPRPGSASAGQPLDRARGAWALAAFGALLVGLPAVGAALPGVPAVGVIGGFFRAGSLVFGGGHVLLPLLQAETVEKGLLSDDRFLAGYGAAQALPGPLSAFAAYLGVSLASVRPHGWTGGLVCLVPSSCPRPCWWSACCRSGSECERGRMRRPPSRARTRRSSACCWRRGTNRCGRARCRVGATSSWSCSPLACWRSGAVRPGSSSGSLRASVRSRCGRLGSRMVAHSCHFVAAKPRDNL